VDLPRADDGDDEASRRQSKITHENYIDYDLPHRPHSSLLFGLFLDGHLDCRFTDDHHCAVAGLPPGTELRPDFVFLGRPGRRIPVPAGTNLSNFIDTNIGDLEKAKFSGSGVATELDPAQRDCATGVDDEIR